MKNLTINDIRDEFRKCLQNKDFVKDKSGANTIDLIGVSFIANEPYIFGTPNKEYIEKEIKWYNSMLLNINNMDGEIPKIWKQVSDENGNVNSNYGWCIYSQDNYNQFNNAKNHLINEKNSRRAILIYTRPSMHLEYNKNGMDDFICTNTVQFLIRENYLIGIVSMRSNDAIFGYKNDYAWQKHVYNLMHFNLKSEYPWLLKKDLIWQANSFHIYEKHFELIK